jgi:hypothetical protein
LADSLERFTAAGLDTTFVREEFVIKFFGIKFFGL